MKTLKLSTRLRNKISSSSLELRKQIHQRLRTRAVQQKTILFVVGCQRAGTSLMLRIFERDLNTKVYGEFSPLSSDDWQHKLRLNPLDSVKRIIDRDRASLIILKPLVETQNLLQLLDYFEGSKALFMYRYYKDVASSNLKVFGIDSGINDLRPVVESDPSNWRSERVSENVRNIVIKHFSEDMNPYDAAALFWFLRNSLFFELNLESNPDVMMCQYQDLVTNPLGMMHGIYEFIDTSFPGKRLVKEVHATSLGKGRDVELSPEVNLLCREVLDKLDKVYPTKGNYTR